MKYTELHSVASVASNTSTKVLTVIAEKVLLPETPAFIISIVNLRKDKRGFEELFLSQVIEGDPVYLPSKNKEPFNIEEKVMLFKSAADAKSYIFENPFFNGSIGHISQLYVGATIATLLKNFSWEKWTDLQGLTIDLEHEYELHPLSHRDDRPDKVKLTPESYHHKLTNCEVTEL